MFSILMLWLVLALPPHGQWFASAVATEMSGDHVHHPPQPDLIRRLSPEDQHAGGGLQRDLSQSLDARVPTGQFLYLRIRRSEAVWRSAGVRGCALMSVVVAVATAVSGTDHTG